MKKIVFLLLILLFLDSCTKETTHFINDENYREEVKKQFNSRKSLLEDRNNELFSVFSQKLSTEQKEALEFLYAYMPLSDLADYDGEFFLKQVKASLITRNTFSWSKEIPEDTYRHFVFPFRVNNEDLDTARIVFFNELKDRVQHLSIHDAALEVNHWCHEKATYKGSDSRTSSPLATVKSSFGRCGEESTFTVAAMRAVGIPARQVYTPRWAHSDDNHAWVEVFVDGKWQYLGACEPEPILNKGWFDKPTKRGMFIHTNVFGNYKDTNQNVFKTPLYTKINTLENYTKTKQLIVKIINENNQAICDAEVRFCVYNYAEFYPLVTIKSNKNGLAKITTGLGDLLVSASKNEICGETKAIGTSTDTVVIKLKKNNFASLTDTLMIVPPVDLEITEVNSEKKTENNLRLVKEDSLRNAYQATFKTKKEAEKLALTLNLDTEKVVDCIQKSLGNWQEIRNYLQKNASDKRVLDLLSVISEKDLRDVSENTLTEHLKATKPNETYAKDIYNEAILNPRLENEFLRPYKAFLQTKFSEEFAKEARENIQTILDWVYENIEINNDENYAHCPISPVGTYKLKHTDDQGRSLFFVALCRSLHIPARINTINHQTQYYKNGKWLNISFNKAKKALCPTANLILKTDDKNSIHPEYYTHFTLQYFKNGKFETLNYYGNNLLKNYPVTLNLIPGYYCLMTGHRDNNGSVRVLRKFFSLKEGKTLIKQISLLPLEKSQKVLGNLDTTTSFEDEKNQKYILHSLLAKKGAVFAILDPAKEPTRHVIVDIPLLKKEFNTQKVPFVFIIPKEKLTSDFSIDNYKKLPKNSLFVVDKDNSLTNKILEELKLPRNSFYPIVCFSNKKGEVTFISTGYTIGIGENLLKQMQ